MWTIPKRVTKPLNCIKKAFGLSLGYNLSYEDPEDMRKWGLNIADDYVPRRGYFHADLMRDGETVLSVSAEGDSGIPRGIQFIELSMIMGCEDEVKKALHDHGFNPFAASVTDPFNVNWFICV
jgi:uncharacterized glyoxalase superfamily protein PhnB